MQKSLFVFDFTISGQYLKISGYFWLLYDAVSRAGKYSLAVRNDPSQNTVSNLGLKP